MFDPESIYKITDKYNTITFDVFDTLVIRDVMKPTNVFKYCYGFFGRYIRVISEIIARMKTNSGEVTLKEIQNCCMLDLNKEIEFEINNCRANPKIYSIYDKLVKDGKKIYAISDMYLDSKTISQILKKCGYDIPVMVSCEYGKSKKNGELFKLFLEQNNIKPDEVIHIGDNKLSDIEGAKKVGISTILINKHDIKLAYTKYNKRNEELAAFINHGLNELSNPIEKIGYEIVGPIILAFCQWIHNKYLEEKFDCLFFLARDMQFTFDIYKDLYKEDKIKYLYVSRKSFLFSREHPNEIIKYFLNEGVYGNVAIVDAGWLGNAQVEIQKYSKIIEENSDIGGLYLGLKLASKFIRRSNRSYSCLFSNYFDRFQCELIAPFMETLIGSNDKQVISYNDGVPVFDRNDNRDKTKTIKDGARKFIEDWIKLKHNKDINLRYVRKAFLKMFKYPKGEHILLIGNLHYEDFKDTSIVSFDENYSYKKDIKKWLSDLSYSGWKGAFFKKSIKLYKPFLNMYLILNTLRIILLDIDKIYNKKL